MQISRKNLSEKTEQIYDVIVIGDLKVGLNQVIIAAGDGALAATDIWREIRRNTGAKPWLENLSL
jgi:thioredoxin reductase (NADPH)